MSGRQERAEARSVLLCYGRFLKHSSLLYFVISGFVASPGCRIVLVSTVCQLSQP